MVYNNRPPVCHEIFYTTGAGDGVKVSMAILPSSGGGVASAQKRLQIKTSGEIFSLSLS